jgi:hypothetical protein
MQIQWLRACAATLALALGWTALPAVAQNNNAAFNRRLAVSEPSKAYSETVDVTVRPANLTQPVARPATSTPTPVAQPSRVEPTRVTSPSTTPTPAQAQLNVATTRTVQAQQPIYAAPIPRPQVERTPAAAPTYRQEIMAGDQASRPTMLQPIPARPINTVETAPAPVVPSAPVITPAPTIVQAPSANAPSYVASNATQMYQPAAMPAVSGPASQSYGVVYPQGLPVNHRRAFQDAPQPMPESMGSAPMAGGFDASSGGCDDCGCDDCCCENGGPFGGSFRRGAGRWLAGGEFLFARPHFSEATAYILHQNPILGPGNNLAAADTYVNHEFDYEPSFRAYVGYRLDECCAELRGTYTRLQSDASKSAAPNANASIVPTYFEVQPAPGDTLTSNMGIVGDVFDVDFSRCIRAGGECIPCDCRTCPDWSLAWSAGAKFANWDMNSDVFTTDPTDGRLDIEYQFIGAGPRVGLEGNRYFGRWKQFSIYSSFDASLLVGWYEYQMVRSVPSVGVNPSTTETFTSKATRTIPVTEIELGLRYQPYERLTVSAGWFFHTWWDLGTSTQQASPLLGGVGPQFMLDDANIMSWDGLTVKAEISF